MKLFVGKYQDDRSIWCVFYISYRTTQMKVFVGKYQDDRSIWCDSKAVIGQPR